MRAVGPVAEGRPDGTVVLLEKATSVRAADASLFSDLAAAYLARAERGDPLDRLRALEMALRATQLAPALPEARFNLALALEKSALVTAARRAWLEYEQVDPNSAWTAEAELRLRRLEKPSRLALWAEEKPMLEAAALAEDETAVNRAVAEYPFRIRVYAEDELLPRWAELWRAGRMREALRALETARRIGRALAAVGEPMVADSITRIDRLLASQAGDDYLSALAGAHAALVRGSTLCLDSQVEHGTSLLAGALAAFERAQSPAALWSLYDLAVCDYERSAFHSALARLVRLQRNPAIGRYPSVLARSRWMTGLTLMSLAEPAGAQSNYEQALATFEQEAAWSEVGGLCLLLAENQSYLGDDRKAWRFLRRSLEIAVAEGDQRRQFSAFDITANVAVKQGFAAAASFFRNEVVRLALVRPDPPGEAHALLRRAETRYRLGQTLAAERDLGRARAACARIGDVSERGQREADLLVADGEIRAAREPQSAVASFTRALQIDEAAGRRFPIVGIYLARAKAFLALGRAADAERDLLAGIAEFERQRPQVRSEALRIVYFDQARELFDRLIELQASLPDERDQAFASAERQRARVLLDRLTIRPLSLAEVRRRLPDDVVLVAYASLPERLLIWVVRGGERIPRIDVPVSARTLAALTDAASGALTQRPVPATADERLTALHEWILRPVRDRLRPGDTIVFVPDKSLYGVPFAALRDPGSRRYLIEDHALAVAPSASLYTAPARLGRVAAGSSLDVTVVADPAFEEGSYGLPRLPGAAREGPSVLTRFAGRGIALAGRSATPAAFLREAGRRAVAHVAAHALLDGEHPHLSSLLLAPEAAGDSGLLTAGTIQEVSLPRTRLVVLAACRSGRGRVANEGSLSLARAFLAAGVPEVVASLWDLEDAAAGELSRDFYAGLLRGDDAPAALRGAQVAALRRVASGTTRAGDWAALLISLGPHGKRVGRRGIESKRPSKEQAGAHRGPSQEEKNDGTESPDPFHRVVCLRAGQADRSGQERGDGRAGQRHGIPPRSASRPLPCQR
ncbi:MAG TPA: CHAT domain-containing protein [Thermoanaerobaculia bacterium]|nr:CHAT domain-containing protein [Thermoanaerobaculia bacterium]